MWRKTCTHFRCWQWHMTLLCRHHIQHAPAAVVLLDGHHAKAMACGVQESAIATAKHGKSQDCSARRFEKAVELHRALVADARGESWRFTSSSPGQLDQTPLILRAPMIA